MATRPKDLEGKTRKIKVGCGTLYLTVNFHDKKPVELFLNGSKLGGCRANQEGLSRLVSLAFKTGTSVADVIDQLELIKCPACTRAKAKLDNEKEVQDFPTSCSDAVAKFLKSITD